MLNSAASVKSPEIDAYHNMLANSKIVEIFLTKNSLIWLVFRLMYPKNQKQNLDIVIFVLNEITMNKSE